MLISDAYRDLQRKMHEDSDYGRGVSSKYTYDAIRRFYGQENCASLLDYGCGKGRLKSESFPTAIEYDPAIPGKDGDPPVCDMVVCLDVLEHIERENIDDVLAHIASKMSKVGIFTIATRPANRMMPDGRNAHLIVHKAQWWLDRVEKFFRVLGFQGTDRILTLFVGKP